MTSAGSVAEVFRTFLRLGLTSFGGPIAHLGYLRAECVERRRWLDDHQYGQLVALCQFLPGPASSQLGFALGLLRAGWAGAVAAFIAFTLPSVVLLMALAGTGTRFLTGGGAAVAHGLKLVALAVVAHGVIRMAGTMATGAARAGIALAAAAAILYAGTATAQILVLAGGAAAGILWCRGAVAGRDSPQAIGYGRGIAILAMVLFSAGLLAALSSPSTSPGIGAVGAAFYRAGALVFGGGHVVLPLLETSVVATGWVTTDTFLAGYGAAQAVPGPMFSVAALLGAEVPIGASPLLGGVVATLAVFTPGFLVLVAVLPIWARLHTAPGAGGAIAGVNAAVVGLLAAALYDPIWVSAVRAPMDVAVAAAALVMLWRFERATLAVVVWCVGASVLLALGTNT